jgi:hypothetical protein
MVLCEENAMYFFLICFGAHWTLVIVIPIHDDDDSILLNMTYINTLNDPLTWRQFIDIISYESIPLVEIIASYFS